MTQRLVATAVVVIVDEFGNSRFIHFPFDSNLPSITSYVSGSKMTMSVITRLLPQFLLV